jgi:hypothetical protein
MVMVRFRCGLRQTGIDVVAHLGLRGLGSATMTCAVPVPLPVAGCRDSVKRVLEPIGEQPWCIGSARATGGIIPEGEQWVPMEWNTAQGVTRRWRVEDNDTRLDSKFPIIAV